ncbi:unnamed protein product [Adineta ricciae]|uniref:G-protein coupled receptors family 1 profile domain-containing protein n=1 Tax=Adineta ricciae TaxID=249248 RepID=A0A815ZHW4_ADIRI|nr:unnamed protein product [Adineta ricciae]CAF1583012.1 unnamed protein product [Adineta ricciae]
MTLNSTIAYLRDVTDEIRFIFGLFNLVVGLISNLSLIIILTNLKIFRKTPSSFYLVAESYSNIGLLIFVCSSRISIGILRVDPTLVSLQWCKFRYGFNQVFGLCSLFIICFTIIDQYFSTNHRYTIRQLSTMKCAYLFLIIALLLSSSHGILFYIYADIHSLPFGCSIYNVMMKKYLSYFYFPVLSNALPILITMTFSLLSYRNVRRIVRRQIPIRRRRLDQQLTSMILIRVVSLIFFGLPYIIVSLYQLNVSNNDNNLKSTIAVFLGALFYSLLYTNFSINFYLFLLISSRFRCQVKHFIRKLFHRCCHQRSSLRHIKLKNNQIAPETFVKNISTVESI